jgi:hypothetical protein
LRANVKALPSATVKELKPPTLSAFQTGFYPEAFQLSASDETPSPEAPRYWGQSAAWIARGLNKRRWRIFVFMGME